MDITESMEVGNLKVGDIVKKYDIKKFDNTQHQLNQINDDKETARELLANDW